MKITIPEYKKRPDIGIAIGGRVYINLLAQVKSRVYDYGREWPSNTDFPFAEQVTQDIIEDVLKVVNKTLFRCRSIK